MIYMKANIWDYNNDRYLVIIPTNGFVKKDNTCVMGRGLALQAKRKYKGIDSTLGLLIKGHGNSVHLLSNGLVSFPVKHNWWEKASYDLIKKSCDELKELMKQVPNKTVVIPRVGCGCGHLSWNNVKIILENNFKNSNIIVVDLKGENI